MDNVKIGDVIRTARKKKGLTQKDIATHLHITDRAVSKWERGICAPDLALLEPLAEILEISITELITGEEELSKENKEEIELVVKETIQYSKQEIGNNKKANRCRMFILFLIGLFFVSTLLLYLYSKGFFHKIGTYPSPNGTTTATVYNCNLFGNKLFPTNDGFTVETTGYYRGSTTYTNCEFRGLNWSSDGNYMIISMYDSDNNTYMELTDYIRNCGCNLNVYLEIALYENEFFSKVPNRDSSPEINFEFIQWSTADPAVLLLYFNYKDIDGNLHEGYTWYDYQTGCTSGEMELELGEKEEFWLHRVWY